VTPEQFREFTFVNAVRLHGASNARLFEGTVCERAAKEALAADGPA
jgi:hypothetical protein